MMVKRIEGGQARSKKEIIASLGQRSCPSCGNRMRMRWMEEDDGGAVVRMHSRHCETEYDVVFTPGPGWERRPDDPDPRYGATEDPSTIVAEPVFRRLFELALQRLREASPAPAPDADPSDLEIWDAGIQADAHMALGTLLELQKLAVAAGRPPDAELAKLVPWLEAVLQAPRTAWRPGGPT